MAILPDASAASLHLVVTDVQPGATVITDGWQGNPGIERLGPTACVGRPV